MARVKDPIRQLLLKLAKGQFQDKLFWSVDDAVVNAEKLRQRLGKGGKVPLDIG